jgi:hypothetical protein
MPDGDQPTIVYVHGIGNKQPAEILRADWDRALFGRDLGRASRMAYWADLRYTQPLLDRASDELPVPPGDARAGMDDEGPGEIEPTADFLDRTAEEDVPGQGRAVDALRRLGARMAWRADALAAGEEGRQVRVGERVLPLPSPWRMWLFRRFIKAFLADVHAYVEGGLKEPIQARLRQALQGLDGPVVMVGHSLGSVVAYDVLHDYRGPLDVRLLVTVGSPLGTQEIQDVAARPLQVPGSTRAWLNAADGRDLVALDPTIRPEYPPAERCTDYLVENDADAHHHGISGYLTAAPVQRAIRQHFEVP